MKLIAVVLALFACANALESEVSLKDRIVMSLESFSENQAEVEIENQAMGVENCENKCNNVRLTFQLKFHFRTQTNQNLNRSSTALLTKLARIQTALARTNGLHV